MARNALGRGLEALIREPEPTAATPPQQNSPFASAVAVAPAQTVTAGPLQVDIDLIDPSPFQPRTHFSETGLEELSRSIRTSGIIQPLVVRKIGARFQLIAGERRWRASQRAQLLRVPVVVREVSDEQALELTLVENIQREDLNPIEESQGYAQLIEQFQLKQEEVATKVGKSRAAVANALRLLKLTPAIQDHIRQGRLSVGHAKVILGLAGEKLQNLSVERILKDGLNVRQTEVLVARLQVREAGPATRPGSLTPLTHDAHVASLENKLRERLGTKVRLRYAHGKGGLEISFFSDDELERILQILGVSAD